MQLLKSLHKSAPVDAICFYRALLGALLFYESFTWIFHTTELFSNAGFHLPNLEWMPAPSPVLAFLLCLALMISSLMVALGLFTKGAILCTIAIWGYFYSLDSINEKADETIALILLTILFFSPCHRKFSFDRWRRIRSGKPTLSETSSIFWQRLLQIEFAQIYFFSGISKMMNPDWVKGTTFYWILNGPWATSVGVYLSTLNLNILARMGGLGTILFELSMGLLLFVEPLRPVAIVMGLCFHLGIQATLGIGTLGFHFMLALVLIFPEPEAVREKLAAGRVALNRTLLKMLESQ